MRHCHMTHLCVTWPIHVWHDSSMCDMTHPYVMWLIRVWHDLFIYHMTTVMRDLTHSCMTWLTYIRHNSFISDMTHAFLTWLIHVWHDSFISGMTTSSVTCLIRVYGLAVPHLGWVTWLIHTSERRPLYVTCLIRVNDLAVAHLHCVDICGVWLDIHVDDTTHPYGWHDSFV